MKTSLRTIILFVLLVLVGAISSCTHTPRAYALHGMQPPRSEYTRTETPLEQAVREFNEYALRDPVGKTQPPLTVDEVVANIRGWDRQKDPISDKTYQVFQEIVKTRTLPKGSSLRSINSWHGINGDNYTVWWVDLCVNLHLWEGPDKYMAYLNGGGLRIRSQILDSTPGKSPQERTPPTEAQSIYKRMAEIRKAAAARVTEKTGTATMTREEYEEFRELLKKTPGLVPGFHWNE